MWVLHVDKRRRRRRVRLALGAAAVAAAVGAAVAGEALFGEPEPLLTEDLGVEWDLAFRDDFSEPPLHPTRWSDHEPWQSDGYATSDGWHPVPLTTEQVEVTDGRLVLKARRGEDLPEDKPFTTAHISTRDSFSIPESATSYTEARLKAPSAKGLLPAFWLLGNGDNSTGEGWPITGEVDILEFANNDGENGTEGGRPYFSVWYPKDVHSDPPGSFLNGTHDTHPDSVDRRPELVDTWHTWGLYRSPERMDLYIDGVREATFRPGETYGELPLPEMLFTEDMHVRLSLGVGGDWAGAGLDEDQYEEGDLEVDHVRVWLADE